MKAKKLRTIKEIESLDTELRKIKSKIESKEGSSEIPRLKSILAEIEDEIAVLSKQRNKLFERYSKVRKKRDSDL